MTTSPISPSVIKEMVGSVLVLTMNRPEVCNAMSRDMYRLLIAGLEDGLKDPAVRCVMITGTGKFFAAGRDLTEAAKDDNILSPHETFETKMYSGEDAAYVYNYLSRYRKPVVTAVNGPAIGGGAAIAFLGDVSIASQDAYFMFPEIEHGVTAVGATLALPRLIGRAKAMLMILTCRRVGAAEADQLGLVSMTVPAAELMKVAHEVAATIAAKRPEAVRLFKAALQCGPWGDSEKADLAREALAALGETQERVQAMRRSAKRLDIPMHRPA